jgi:hypothetical protein
MRTKSAHNLIALIVILIGFGLRIHQLGHDSFWNDEVGQALAAIQPTVSGMLTIMRSHAMAMPLDYCVSRLTSWIGIQETIMRFPVVIYGTLTLALYFSFVRRISEFKIALVTIWLSSVCTLCILYSQEMRFYAALGLFYVLSNWLLLKALYNSTVDNWALFVVVTAIGVYFHPYVLLVPVNGFLYYLLERFPPRFRDKKLFGLFTSTIILGGIFLPGYLYFGTTKFHYGLLQFANSFFEGIATGLGWLTFPFTKATPVFGNWELLCAMFTIIGAATVFKRREEYKYLISIVVGACIQIALIILADSIKGYWLVYRQFAHLAPTMLILTATGIVGVVEYISQTLKKSNRLGKNISDSMLLCITLIVLSLFVMPRLTEYYRFSKSNGRQIATRLVQVCGEGAPIVVIPGHEEIVYEFYLLHGDDVSNGPDVAQALRPTDWTELQGVLADSSADWCLITPSTVPSEHFQNLTRLGFRVIEEPAVEARWYGQRLLWVGE